MTFLPSFSRSRLCLFLLRSQSAKRIKRNEPTSKRYSIKRQSAYDRLKFYHVCSSMPCCGFFFCKFTSDITRNDVTQTIERIHLKVINYIHVPTEKSSFFSRSMCCKNVAREWNHAAWKSIGMWLIFMIKYIENIKDQNVAWLLTFP